MDALTGRDENFVLPAVMRVIEFHGANSWLNNRQTAWLFGRFAITNLVFRTTTEAYSPIQDKCLHLTRQY